MEYTEQNAEENDKVIHEQQTTSHGHWYCANSLSIPNYHLSTCSIAGMRHHMVSVAVWHCLSTAQRSFETIFHSWFIHWASMKFICHWQHKFVRNITCKIPSQVNVVPDILNFLKSKLGRLKWHLRYYRFPKLIIPKVRATNSGYIEAIINMTQDWCLSNGVIVRFFKINWVLALKAPCTTLRHERLLVKMKLAKKSVKKMGLEITFQI